MFRLNSDFWNLDTRHTRFDFDKRQKYVAFWLSLWGLRLRPVYIGLKYVPTWSKQRLSQNYGDQIWIYEAATRDNEMFINFFRDSGMYVLNRFCCRGSSIHDKGNCYALGNECCVDFFYIWCAYTYGEKRGFLNSTLK